MDLGEREQAIHNPDQYQTFQTPSNYWPNMRFKDAVPASHQERGIVSVDYARAIPYGEMRHPDGTIRMLASMDEFHSNDSYGKEWMKLKSGKLVNLGELAAAADVTQVPLYEEKAGLGRVVVNTVVWIGAIVVTGVLFHIGWDLVGGKKARRG